MSANLAIRNRILGHANQKILTNILQISGKEERRRKTNLLFAQLTRLRPPWLAMSVAAAVCDVSSVERPSDIGKLTRVDSRERNDSGSQGCLTDSGVVRFQIVPITCRKKTLALELLELKIPKPKGVKKGFDAT